MRHPSITNRTTNYAHQVWLASLGALETLQKEGKQIFRELVKEGKSVQARSQPSKAYRHAEDNSLVQTVTATKAAYQRKFERQLKEWDAQLDQLAAKAKRAKADARLKVEDQIAGLKARRTAVQSKLDDLRNASENAWEDLKDGVEQAWGDINDALRRVSAHFK